MKRLFLIAALLTVAGIAKAQFAVIDPTNLAGNIINTAKSIAEASKTTTNIVNTFNEAKRIYNQGKEYYDALKSVHNLVRDARKVQQTILMVGEISEIYVNSFQKMMADHNFSVEELGAIASGYAKLLSESALLVTELKNVTTANGLSMSDAERMQFIDRIYSEVHNYKNLVLYFTNKNISVSYLRAKKKNDTDRIINLYGSPTERYW